MQIDEAGRLDDPALQQRLWLASKAAARKRREKEEKGWEGITTSAPDPGISPAYTPKSVGFQIVACVRAMENVATEEDAMKSFRMRLRSAGLDVLSRSEMSAAVQSGVLAVESSSSDAIFISKAASGFDGRLDEALSSV